MWTQEAPRRHPSVCVRVLQFLVGFILFPYGFLCVSVSHSDAISLTPAPVTLICDWLSWHARGHQRRFDLPNNQLQKAAGCLVKSAFG